MKNDSIAICGTNTTTLPTPAITPSTIRSASAPSGSSAATPDCSQPAADSMAPMNGSDQENSASNSSAMTAANAAMPYNLCVRMPSMRSVQVRRTLAAPCRTSATSASIQR